MPFQFILIDDLSWSVGRVNSAKHAKYASS